MKNLEEMILIDQKPADNSDHDNDEDSDNGEDPISLLGEWRHTKQPIANRKYVTFMLPAVSLLL